MTDNAPAVTRLIMVFTNVQESLKLAQQQINATPNQAMKLQAAREFNELIDSLAKYKLTILEAVK